MKCNYSFSMLNGDEYECEDCELRAFKFWFSLIKKEVRCGLVMLDNGERWLYYYGEWEKL